MKRRRYNPWTHEPPSPEEAPARRETVHTAQGTEIGDLAPRRVGDHDDVDVPIPAAHIVAQGYGQLRVEDAPTLTEGVARLLNWCIAHPQRSAIDTVLTEASVVLAQLAEVPAQGFYVRRPDGWAFCVPHALDRSQALFQFVQAALGLQAHPALGPSFNAAGFSASRF